MSNETRHYFGAYLEIKLKPRETEERGHYCKARIEYDEPRWIVSRFGDVDGYCQFCGERVGSKTRIIKQYPTWLVDYSGQSVLGEEFEDVLSVLGVPSLHKKGTILAKGNHQDDSTWLSLSGYGRDDYPFPQFPTELEIQGMKDSLTTTYATAIDALFSSPLVKTVEVKAGYVLDQEY